MTVKSPFSFGSPKVQPAGAFGRTNLVPSGSSRSPSCFSSVAVPAGPDPGEYAGSLSTASVEPLSLPSSEPSPEPSSEPSFEPSPEPLSLPPLSGGVMVVSSGMRTGRSMVSSVPSG